MSLCVLIARAINLGLQMLVTLASMIAGLLWLVAAIEWRSASARDWGLAWALSAMFVGLWAIRWPVAYWVHRLPRRLIGVG